jgi:hypothetical protein
VIGEDKEPTPFYLYYDDEIPPADIQREVEAEFRKNAIQGWFIRR